MHIWNDYLFRLWTGGSIWLPIGGLEVWLLTVSVVCVVWVWCAECECEGVDRLWQCRIWYILQTSCGHQSWSKSTSVRSHQNEPGWFARLVLAILFYGGPSLRTEMKRWDVVPAASSVLATTLTNSHSRIAVPLWQQPHAPPLINLPIGYPARFFSHPSPFHCIMYFIIPQNTLTPPHPFTIYYWRYTTLHYHTNYTLHTVPHYLSFVPLVSRHSPLCLYRFHIAAYFIICYPTSRYNLLPMVRRNRE